MSRIVKGGNAEVRDFKLTSPVKTAEAKNFEGRSFKGGRVEGTYYQKEVDALLEQARAEGRIQGQKETEKKLSGPLNQGLQNVENILDEVSKFRRELFKEAEEEVLDFIRLLAKKVLYKELSLDPSIIKTMVEKSLDLLEKEKRIVVLFNPADTKFFATAKEDFLKVLQNSTELRIAMDPKVDAGTALIKTETVQVDVSVESMVDQLMSQLGQAKVQEHEVNNDEDKI